MPQTIEACAQTLGAMFAIMLVTTPATAIIAAALTRKAETDTLIQKTKRMLEATVVLSIPTGLTMAVLAIILHNIALTVM